MPLHFVGREGFVDLHRVLLLLVFRPVRLLPLPLQLRLRNPALEFVVQLPLQWRGELRHFLQRVRLAQLLHLGKLFHLQGVSQVLRLLCIALDLIWTQRLQFCAFR